MTLKECYAAVNGDYDGAMKRLRSEKLVLKFVNKLLEDPNVPALRAALAAGDQDTAFRAAHTIKGVCLNLGFTKAGDSISRLTESLRTEITAEATILMAEFEADYAELARTMQALD